MRQEYPLETLQAILDNYPNKGRIANATLFTSGFENSNFLLDTESGKYVLKIFEGMNLNIENIAFEIEVIDQLSQNNLKVPHIFKTNDSKLFTALNDKYAVLMDFIEGENMDKKIISDSLAREIGEQTGRMDAILSKFEDGSKARQDYEFDLKHFLTLEDKLKYLDTNFDQSLFQGIFESFKSVQSNFKNAKSGLIHNDVVLHNILASGDQLDAIIDFSDMVYSPYIQNIATALCQCFFTYNWNPKQAGIFIEEYLKYHSLLQTELKLLYILVQVRFAVLIIEFNYWNKEFGEDEQRTQFIHNNYNFLKRFREISEDEFNRIIKI